MSAEWKQQGRAAIAVQGNISDATERRALVDAAYTTWGRLDLLVNNAGITSPGRNDILEATEESFEWVMKINLQGPYFLTQAVANWMIEQQQANEDFEGCIVFVLDMRGGRVTGLGLSLV